MITAIPTGRLRFFNEVLQQEVIRFTDGEAGEIMWRPVPVVVEEIDKPGAGVDSGA